ncbi:MAG: hypothetical protein JW969_10840 [Spirochaetales bacterium]|nr:hypothetical protein [Spirochaetales bacterium]
MERKKRAHKLLLAFILLTAVLAGNAFAAPPAGYSLVWSDECNGAANTAVDGSKWNRFTHFPGQ